MDVWTEHVVFVTAARGLKSALKNSEGGSGDVVRDTLPVVDRVDRDSGEVVAAVD